MRPSLLFPLPLAHRHHCLCRVAAACTGGGSGVAAEGGHHRRRGRVDEQGAAAPLPKAAPSCSELAAPTGLQDRRMRTRACRPPASSFPLPEICLVLPAGRANAVLHRKAPSRADVSLWSLIRLASRWRGSFGPLKISPPNMRQAGRRWRRARYSVLVALGVPRPRGRCALLPAPLSLRSLFLSLSTLFLLPGVASLLCF